MKVHYSIAYNNPVREIIQNNRLVSVSLPEISFVPTSEEFLFDPENIHVFVQVLSLTQCFQFPSALLVYTNKYVSKAKVLQMFSAIKINRGHVLHKVTKKSEGRKLEYVSLPK